MPDYRIPSAGDSNGIWKLNQVHQARQDTESALGHWPGQPNIPATRHYVRRALSNSGTPLTDGSGTTTAYDPMGGGTYGSGANNTSSNSTHYIYGGVCDAISFRGSFSTSKTRYKVIGLGMGSLNNVSYSYTNQGTNSWRLFSGTTTADANVIYRYDWGAYSGTYYGGNISGWGGTQVLPLPTNGNQPSSHPIPTLEVDTWYTAALGWHASEPFNCYYATNFHTSRAITDADGGTFTLEFASVTGYGGSNPFDANSSSGTTVSSGILQIFKVHL